MIDFEVVTGLSQETVEQMARDRERANQMRRCQCGAEARHVICDDCAKERLCGCGAPAGDQPGICGECYQQEMCEEPN